MIQWCNEHNITYTIESQWNSGEGYCDDVQEDVIKIKIPGKFLDLCARPTEHLAYEEYKIKEIEEKIKTLIEVEEVREDSKRVTALRIELNKHESRLFQWGFEKTRQVEAKDLEKEFVLE